MEKKQKNYLIYLIILVLFGGLIYAAIRGGSHLFQVSASEVASGENAFEMFTSILQDNLNHPLSILLLQIIIVLFVVRVFTILFKWLRQPGVIGEIVAGIVIGPSVLGALYPEFFGFIFRPESLTNLELISQLGLVLFMFVIGMEVDFGTLKSRLNKTIVISHTGILLSFFLGILASFWIYEEYASHQTPFLPFPLSCRKVHKLETDNSTKHEGTKSLPYHPAMYKGATYPPLQSVPIPYGVTYRCVTHPTKRKTP